MAEVGSKLIFENERVKVWEFTLLPALRCTHVRTLRISRRSIDRA